MIPQFLKHICTYGGTRPCSPWGDKEGPDPNDTEVWDVPAPAGPPPDTVPLDPEVRQLLENPNVTSYDLLCFHRQPFRIHSLRLIFQVNTLDKPAEIGLCTLYSDHKEFEVHESLPSIMHTTNFKPWKNYWTAHYHYRGKDAPFDHHVEFHRVKAEDHPPFNREP